MRKNKLQLAVFVKRCIECHMDINAAHFYTFLFLSEYFVRYSFTHFKSPV